MKVVALVLLLLLGVVLIAGCTAGPTSQGNEQSVQGVIDEFGETLLNETDDVEIGSLI